MARQGADRFFDLAVTAGLVAALAWSAVGLGSGTPLAWTAGTVVLPLLVVIFELGQAARRRTHPVHLARAAVPLLCIMAVLVAVAAQRSGTSADGPLPWPWPVDTGLVASAPAGTLPIDLGAASWEILQLMPVPAAFWLALQLGRDRSRAGHLLLALTAIGGLCALSYLLAAAAAVPDAPWHPPTVNGSGFVAAAAADRAGFGAYAAMALVCSVGMVIAALPRMKGLPWADRLDRLAHALAGREILPIVVIPVLVTALFLGGTPQGLGIAAVGILVLVALALARSGGSARPLVIGLSAVAVLLSAGLVAGEIWGGGAAVDGRNLGTGASPPAAGATSAGAIAAGAPWRAGRIVLDLSAAALALVALAVLALRMLSGALGRHRNWIPSGLGVASAAVAGVCAAAGSGLQYQGVVVTWAAIAGVAVAQSWSGRVDTTVRSRPGGASAGALDGVTP